MTIQPLIWLLIFVFVVAIIYASVKWLGVPLHPRLEQLMVGLVGLIVIVVLLVWLLGLLGWHPGHLLEGPAPLRR